MSRAILGAVVGVAAALTFAGESAAGQPAASAAAGEACPDPGDTGEERVRFPEQMSSLVGADIRTGGHECFERVVIELQGSGDLPGYWVRYESDPIVESPSGLPIDVAGDATLMVSFGSWMNDTEGTGYAGPSRFVPDNVVNIAELVMTENFEGMTTWAIGLDRQRGFDVFTLTEPSRIVIDIATDQPAAPTTTTTPAATSPVTTSPATATTVAELPRTE